VVRRQDHQHLPPSPDSQKPRRHTVDGTTSTRLRTGLRETASECVASPSLSGRGATQRCEAIDLGTGRTCGSIRASGRPRADQTGSRTDHAPCVGREGGWPIDHQRRRSEAQREGRYGPRVVGVGWSSRGRIGEVPTILLRPSPVSRCVTRGASRKARLAERRSKDVRRRSTGCRWPWWRVSRPRLEELCDVFGQSLSDQKGNGQGAS
jgi:hypothetical protein